MSNFLNGSFGFTAGAFSPSNTGETGKGWGINNSTYFQIKQDEVFYISQLGGLLINFYSFLYMNPFEKMDFLIDASEINQTYFNVTQEENLLYIVPNFQKISEDNFLDSIFHCSLTCVGTNGSEAQVTFSINFQRDKVFDEGDIYIDCTDQTMPYSIPLVTMIKSDIEIDLENKLKITHINNFPISTLGLDYSKLIVDGKLILNTLTSYYNPIIRFQYTNPNDNTHTFSFELRVTNRKDATPLETLISNVYSSVTPNKGDLIDVKDFLSGDPEYLTIKCESSIEIPSNVFRIEVIGHFISIIPNTTEAIKLSGPMQVNKVFSFATKKTKGTFNVVISMDPTHTYKDIKVLDNTTPQTVNKTLTLTDGQFTDGGFLNIEPLLINRVYGVEIPKVKFKDNTTHDSNLIITNVGGPKLGTLNGKNLTVPGTIQLEIMYKNTSYFLNVIVKDDKVAYNENFEISPINIRVTKNSSQVINILDHIIAPLNYYENVSIKITSDKPTVNNVLTYLTPNTVMVNPISYKNLTSDNNGDNITNGTYTGKVTVMINGIYTNDTNLDDFGNIIGYREIPYTLVYSDENNAIDTSENLQVTDLVFYKSREFNLNSADFINNIDIEKILTGVDFPKISKVSINPLTTLDCEIKFRNTDIPSTVDDIVADQILNHFVLEYSKTGWKMVYTDSTHVDIWNDKLLVLDIEYLNSSNVLKTYTQKIKFTTIK